jgi:hypothetical protein
MWKGQHRHENVLTSSALNYTCSARGLPSIPPPSHIRYLGSLIVLPLHACDAYYAPLFLIYISCSVLLRLTPQMLIDKQFIFSSKG